MIWDLFAGTFPASGDVSFLVGFVAALLFFGALAWRGMGLDRENASETDSEGEDSPHSQAVEDLRHHAGLLPHAAERPHKEQRRHRPRHP